MAARRPEPPLRPRSIPLPTDTPTVFASQYQSAKVPKVARSTPQMSATISGVCRPCVRHVGVVAIDPPIDEGTVVGAAPLELRRHREGEHDIGTRADLDEQVGLLRDAHALRIDDDQPGARPPLRAA